jgi:hypothetical protein
MLSRTNMIIYVLHNPPTRPPKARSKEDTPPRRSALKTFVEEVANDEAGYLSDYDERYGEERRYAVDSPPKGKRRLNSAVSTQLMGELPMP